MCALMLQPHILMLSLHVKINVGCYYVLRQRLRYSWTTNTWYHQCISFVVRTPELRAMPVTRKVRNKRIKQLSLNLHLMITDQWSY